MVLNRSCPAVSQICSLTRLPSSSIVRILKSMPIVVINEGVNESSLKRSRQQDLPTPESPINRSLICKERQIRGFRRRWLRSLQGSLEEIGRRTHKKIIIPRSSHRERFVCRVILVQRFPSRRTAVWLCPGKTAEIKGRSIRTKPFLDGNGRDAEGRFISRAMLSLV